MLSDDLVKVAIDLINTYGDTITLVKHDYGTPNLDTGEQPSTDTSTVVKGVYEDYVSEETASGDGKYTVSSTVAVDMFTSLIKANGKEVRILAVKQTGIQDTIIIYEIIVSSDNDLKTP